MIPLEIPQKGKEPFILSDIDEQYRADSTLEKMSKLKPIYGCKAVTAGDAPGLNDSATAIIVMTRGKAQQLGLKPIYHSGHDFHCDSSEPDAGRAWFWYQEGTRYGQDEVRSDRCDRDQ